MKYIKVATACIVAVLYLISFSANAQNYPVKILNDTLTLQQVLKKYPHKIPSDPKREALRDARPNILLINVDDSRWDSYSVNGAPSFFQTPNLDKLANEGVNFKNFFAVHSLCSPSRSTLYTGLYSHKHHVINNALNMNRSIPWISQILHDAGYYTAISGKLAFNPDSVRGYDDFFLSVVESYINSKYFVSTGDTAIQINIPGHTTDLLTQWVIGKMITRPLDRPFFIYLSHRAPHVPYRPRPEDTSKFANDTMPYFNTDKYTKNFPSYYYPFNQAGTPAQQDTEYRGYFRMMIGIEETFGTLRHFMDSVGLTDNTVIMYTSDNGDLKSEHLLQGKQLPQEESMRLPMFIRYPTWFPNHEDIYDEIGTNLDWFPTVLDAAQVPDTFGSDGISLRALGNHQIHRDAFMYEVWAENYTPSMRAVRSAYFKYIYSYCSDTTEQLFDLVNDSLENTNLINDPYYQVVAQYYRCKLDSFRHVTNDNPVFPAITHQNIDTMIVTDSLTSCRLRNLDSSHVGASESPGPIGTCTFPVFDIDTTFNPVGIQDPLFNDPLWNIIVYNLYGEAILRQQKFAPITPKSELIFNESLSPGIYIVEFSNKYSRVVKKIIVQ